MIAATPTNRWRAPGGAPAGSGRRRALEGMLAGAAALATLWLLGAVAATAPFPPLALADRVVRLTPGGIATWMIDHLGHQAQHLLEASAIAAFLAIAAGLGAATARSSRAAAAFAAFNTVAALLAPSATSVPWALAAGAVAGATYAGAMALLRRPRPQAAHAAPQPAPAALDRRAAIAVLASATGGLLASGTLVRQRLSRPGARLASVAAIETGDARRRARFPAIPGLSPEVTPVADHYVVDIDLSDPVLDAATWRLHVDGRVERPLTLAFDELQGSFPLVAEHATLTCISNKVGGPLVGSSQWQGVRLADVLDTVGVQPGAREIALHCADGYSVGIPLEIARHPSTLVALGHNGKALTREHGFPCRIRAPALYGMMNAKWVQRIEVLDHPYVGYWQREGWAADAQVRTASRIDTVTARNAGRPGWVAGLAWAGIRGISVVEVSTDGGRTWRRAVLQPPLSPRAWTRWALAWTPDRPGQHAVTCRATDGGGRLQDPRQRPPHPAGATGYHRIQVAVA